MLLNILIILLINTDELVRTVSGVKVGRVSKGGNITTVR